MRTWIEDPEYFKAMNPFVRFDWKRRRVVEAQNKDGDWRRLDGECEKCGKCCTVCEYLTKDNLCELHDTAWKPWRCVIYPRDPDDILLDGCGYKWVRGE